MKKTTSVFVVLLALLFALTACGSDQPAADNTDDPGNIPVSSQTQSGDPVPDKDGNDARTDGADPEKGILYNANGVTVTLTGLHYDEHEKRWYADTTVTNSTDAEINVSTLESTVNGLSVPLQMYTRCPAGQTVEDSAYFDPQGMAHCVGTGLLREINRVGVKVIIIDGEDDWTHKWSADARVEVAVDPLFIEQSTFEFPYIKKLEQLVYEDDSYRVSCLGLAEDFYGLSDNPFVYFLLTDKGNSPVSISYPNRRTSFAEILDAVENPVDELAVVNGAPCGIGLLYEDIPYGAAAVIHVPILAEKYGVVPGEITSLQFELRIHDQLSSTAGVDLTFPVDLQFQENK